MAEIISNKTAKGAKKLSTRIDLTPMVDLGFILITFFLFTTTLLQHKSMEVNMPVEGPPTEVPDHVAFKLFLGKGHQWYYLTGVDAMHNNFQRLQKVDTKNPYHIRKAISRFREEIQDVARSGRKGSSMKDDLMVLIKPLAGSDYGDMVNALDEMTVNAISRYAVLDLDEKEQDKVVQLGL